MRLWLSNQEEKISISFPWYDTMSEFRRFSDPVLSTATGEIFWDADQGWDLSVKSTATELFVNQGDPDSNEDHYSVSVSRQDFSEKLAGEMLDAERVVTALSKRLGAD